MVTDLALRVAGQLLMVGIPGPTIDQQTRAFLDTYAPGGVILFGRNVTGAHQLRRLVADIKRSGPGVEPLVAIDHEGGRVHRLPRPFTRFPPAARVADHGLRAVTAVGEAMGRELAAVGIDLDFAPVLDVWSNPRNRVIGDRAFGSEPELVARAGVALARGLRRGGVVPCGKHFPGHGATVGDSHDVLPRDRRPRRTLIDHDLHPFRVAIAAGMPALMTAHVVYPALDPRRPATLSHAIAGHLLRRRLGFGGCLFSDDLEMHAVSGHRRIERAAVDAVRAGCDMLLVCNALDRAAAVIDALARAIARGRLAGERVSEAATRVHALRRLRRPDRSGSALRWPAHADLARRLSGAAGGRRRR